MSFAHPFAFCWGLLAIPIAILYLRRLRLPQEQIATGMIWQQVLAEQRGRSAWRRWRRPVSLAVQLAMLALLVLALAEPQIPPPKTIVLIIDDAPRMKDNVGVAWVSEAYPCAKNRGKPCTGKLRLPMPPASHTDITFLTAAKEAAERLIASLRPCDAMAVISAGGPAMPRCTLTAEQSTLREAVASIAGSAGSTQMAEATALANRVLGGNTAGQIVIAGDDAEKLVADSSGLTLGPFLAGLAGVLLVAQWCLYQRRWLN
jgi:hypothetical protein